MGSPLLNSWLGHDLVFKVESFQRTGAFKARGALNALLLAKSKGKAVDEVVTVSSGNHGQAIAWAGRLLQLRVTVFAPADISTVKRQAMEGYGAKVITTPTRAEAEAAVEAMKESGAHFVHPYDDDDVIAGQGQRAWKLSRIRRSTQRRYSVRAGEAVSCPARFWQLTLKPIVSPSSERNPPLPMMLFDRTGPKRL